MALLEKDMRITCAIHCGWLPQSLPWDAQDINELSSSLERLGCKQEISQRSGQQEMSAKMAPNG